MRVNKMAKLATVKAKEDFIVQMNGDYNVPFDELLLTAKVASGDYILNVGIAAADGESGDYARVLVRGNPTTVNEQAINFGSNPKPAALTFLASKGIIVVNK